MAEIVTVYVPGTRLPVEEKMRVEVPEPPPTSTTVDGFNDTDDPDGDTVVLSETLPDSPLMLDKVMVEFADVPGGAVSELGLAETVKSTTWTVI